MSACSGGDPYGGAGLDIPEGSGSGGKGGAPSGTFPGKTGVPRSGIVQICPEFAAGGGLVIGVGGSSTPVGPTGAVAASSADAGGMGGAHGLDDPSQGGVGGSDGTLVPCPSEPPTSEQGQACEGPGICPYADGSTCTCGPCADGWCWSCDVAELPFGCPRVPPEDGQSCAWTGAVCHYGDVDCTRWDNTLAGCCLGKWRVVVDDCARD